MKNLLIILMVFINTTLTAQNLTVLHNGLEHLSINDSEIWHNEDSLLIVNTLENGTVNIQLPEADKLEIELIDFELTEEKSVNFSAQAKLFDNESVWLGGISIVKGDGLFGFNDFQIATDFDILENSSLENISSCIELWGTGSLLGTTSSYLNYTGDTIVIEEIGISSFEENGLTVYTYFIDFENSLTLQDANGVNFSEVEELYISICGGFPLEQLEQFSITSSYLNYAIQDEWSKIFIPSITSIDANIIEPFDTLTISGKNLLYVNNISIGENSIPFRIFNNETIKAVVPYGVTSHTLTLDDIDSTIFIDVVYDCSVPQQLNTQLRKYENAEGNIKGKLKFLWETIPNSIFGNVIYHLEYRNQGTTVWNSIILDTPEYALNELEIPEIIEWRVRADCPNGIPSDFSEIQIVSIKFDNEIAIYSEDLMTAIGECPEDEDLFDYLKNRDDLSLDDVNSFAIDFTNGSRSDEEANNFNCLCAIVTIQPTITLTPQNRTRNSYYFDYVNKHKTKRKHTDWVDYKHGAAQYRAAAVWSKEKNLTYTYNYNQQAADDLPSSDSESRMLMRYVCLEGNMPSYCGCDKEVLLDGGMSSKVSVTGVLGTTPTWYNVSAQNTGLIFHYDDNATNWEVLTGYYNGVAIEANKSWNPTAFTNLAELAGNLATIIFAAVNNTPPTSAQVTNIFNQIGTAINTPFILTSGQQGYKENIKNVSFTKTISISPNELNVVKVVSLAQMFATGSSKKPNIWYGYPKYSNSYYLTAIFNPSNSNTPNECCIEKSAAYMCGSEGYAPVSKSGVKHLVGSISGVYQPWDSSVPIDPLNNVVINNYAGYLNAPARCSPIIILGQYEPDVAILDPNILEPAIVIEWIDRTDTETSFNIERSSSENGNFEIVGEVEENNTLFIDTNLNDIIPFYYYRIVANDIDETGNSPYSDIFEVANPTVGIPTFTKDAFQLSPNPMNDVLYIGWLELQTTKPFQIQLIDITGRIVYNEFHTYNGETTTLEVGHLVEGVYLLSVRMEDQLYTHKVVKH